MHSLGLEWPRFHVKQRIALEMLQLVCQRPKKIAFGEACGRLKALC